MSCKVGFNTTVLNSTLTTQTYMDTFAKFFLIEETLKAKCPWPCYICTLKEKRKQK